MNIPAPWFYNLDRINWINPDQPNSVVLKMNSERGQWKSEVTRYILMSLVASTQHWAAGPCGNQTADISRCYADVMYFN